jgi:hypothetical protein
MSAFAVTTAKGANVRSIFDADPWTVHQVFRIKDIRLWTLWLDGRSRSVSA